MNTAENRPMDPLAVATLEAEYYRARAQVAEQKLGRAQTLIAELRRLCAVRRRDPRRFETGGKEWVMD